MHASSSAQVLPGGMLEVRTHARKGRSLYTTRLVKGGETVLIEAPLLLLVAPEMAHSTCALCLRAVGAQERIACSGCGQACFCSPTCQQTAQATPWGHSRLICSAYARLAALGLSYEDQAQLRFLLHALALRHCGSPEAERRFSALVGLVGAATEGERAVAARLAPALAEVLHAAGVSASASDPLLDVESLATLLRKEQLNSYGVLAAKRQLEAVEAAAAERQQPRAAGSGAGGASTSAGGGSGGAAAGDDDDEGGEGVDGERRLRGSALYTQASLINHECLPNVARFDYFDAAGPHLHPPGGGGIINPIPSSTANGGGGGAPSPPSVPAPTCSTLVVFRALHDLPAGTELAQSYVPLHWGLTERQAQCREVYGFACTCPRCQTESQWSDEAEGEEEDSGWETDSDDGGDGGDAGEDLQADTDAGTPGEQAAAGEAVSGSGGECGEEVEMEAAQAPITAPPGEEGPLEPTYLRLFLLKYMCVAPGCFGTAAPPRPGSSRLECNVCGHTRSERDFLRELEKSQQRQHQKHRHQR